MMNSGRPPLWQGRPASLAEWGAALSWAEREGWDLGAGDAECFFDADAQGFHLGFVDGAPAAAISVVNLDERYAHMGYYLTAPALRGQGWARRLWEEAILHGGARTLGGDGIPAQLHNYAKWGFESQYRTLRLCGAPTARPPAGPGLEPVSPANLDEACGYDQRSGGVRRHAMLRRWFLGAGRRGWISRGADGGIDGLIGARVSSVGYRFGPFYAEHEDARQQLFRQALAFAPAGAALTLDVPETATGLLGQLQGLGLREVFHTFRLYRGEPPRVQAGRIQAIASLELG
ncbi:GNAT family N-acetyltransferase [Chromobacterium alticapitis]|uniref:N-acetyltransferase n=1 Tax=Chromobacterium alticapitis TaxID=2073169 RepID=A0A2S5DE73_9NEIS|nr:GNAT family N-acetyltransferase [Chromobacterium alticapitis]POZ61405.1 N-acetyltransferase [Chromobacterium alticapitis]